MTMQEAIVKEKIANLDLSKVTALQQKRTLAFVNHFVVTTVQFLNHFMKNCEQKLMHFERKLEKVEAAMVLLEARLSSIPEANTTESAQPTQNTTVKSEDTTDQNEASPTDTENIKEEESKESAQSHPEYDRFVKMIQVGVPLQAVKLKVTMEGLDPSVLETIINK
ncbi:WASH complex subunit 3 [Achroia grisella]|uniref:WASH complex subunit 3 n=1 Tax=Achroia grisella TaxID=688607 RepID=UPI0027D2E2E8|nr:WASH complex subunit 3 [Achroia grisella]